MVRLPHSVIRRTEQQPHRRRPAVFELKTFGGPELRTGAGDPVEGLAGRTKDLALLVYLAVEAPDGRIPREQVAALLWPDRTADQARDSGYALAWSGLADAKRLLVFYGHAPADSMIPRAWEAARRALELDPNLAEAHASMGILHRSYRRNGPPALRHLERAVELKPSYARGITGLVTWSPRWDGPRGRWSTCRGPWG